MNSAVSILLGLNAAFALLLVPIGLHRSRTPGVRAFLIMVIADAVWSVLNLTQILAVDPVTKFGLARLSYPCIVVAVVAWWSCCVAYAGRIAFLRPARMIIAALPGVVTLMVVAAGSRSTLMWSNVVVRPGPGPVAFPAGPWFLVHSIWAFALVIGGLVVVAQTMRRAPRAFRPQLTVLLVGVTIPLAVNAVTVQTGLVDTRGHDFTPIATLFSALVFGLGFLRFGLLDLAVGIVPIAHDVVVASMRDGVVTVGVDGRVVDANAAAARILGRSSPLPLGVPIAEVLPTWSSSATSEIDVIAARSDSRTIEVSSAELEQNRGHVIILRDVTDARTAERALRDGLERASYQARHDHLTGLPNRRSLFDTLNQQVGAYALLIIDLDGFKSVNDSYGHGAGDAVLAQLARRLRAASRPDAVVARLGGDEFAVWLPGATQAHAELAAHVAVDALSAPVAADAHDVQLTASVGIAVAPQHGTHSDEVVRAADVAMYSAKRSPHRVAVYGTLDDARSPDRVLMVQELKRGLASDEITCHYQPQVLPDGTIRGVEALVRWQHPERGLLRPAAFLKAARDGGLMRQLSDRVIAVAADQVRVWEAAGREWIVHVNLDADDLGDPLLVHRIEDALMAAAVPPHRFGVEVTESAVFDTSAGARTLEGLRRIGVSIALDDFGTGYGPLAHLRKLPIDQLKLDQSFVSGLTRDRRDAALVAGQIRIGHDLGLLVVAEGVESAASATRLIELHCDVLQGFHVGMPVPASDLRTSVIQFA